MKKFLTLPFLLLGFSAFAQDPIIQAVIDSVRIDSMLHYVEELSGEVPVVVNGEEITIVSRHKTNPGNDQAQQYLMQKLTQFGYTPEVNEFSATGRNVLATKLGTVHQDEIVILCAHFDAMPGGLFAAPAADDDGSGCAALLEAARILRDIPFEYTIVFAFWDEEEQGKVGSINYANQMAANDELIFGAVNMDAIAYDGNGDTQARVHSRPIANSPALADTALAVRDRYGIDIDLILTTPGATYSDHASFWSAGYGAILMIEEFGADGNPQYHTPDDRIQFFDVPYFEKMARLSIGTLATIAVPFNTIDGVVDRAVSRTPTLYAYPNPSSVQVSAWLEVPQADRYRVTLVDALGKEVMVLHNGELAQGKKALMVPFQQCVPGTYTLLAASAGGRVTSTRLRAHALRTLLPRRNTAWP